jgi:hypothetical protein
VRRRGADEVSAADGLLEGGNWGLKDAAGVHAAGDAEERTAQKESEEGGAHRRLLVLYCSALYCDMALMVDFENLADIFELSDRR